MSVAHTLQVRTAIADLIVDKLDAGAAPGKLVFRSSTGVAVATLPLSRPAFGDAVDGVAIAGPIGDDPAAIGGRVAKATLHDGFDNQVLSCTVTEIGGGGDIELNTLQIGAGISVTVSLLRYTAPP
jgi:hypothetical protein